MRRAFTLIELLVVMAIIGILAATLFPVFLSTRGVAFQYSASNAVRQIGSAALMYAGDHDETLMPAMGVEGSDFQTWFGRRSRVDEPFDASAGLLVPYKGKARLYDPVAKGEEYLGDHSGFGYNWGYLGSDFHVTGDLRAFPQCANPAVVSELARPSDTVAFASSVYYNASWLPGGDGKTYDFGFIDPIGSLPDNPNVDFRHLKPRRVDKVRHRIVQDGSAVGVMADGHARTWRFGALRDTAFMRDPEAPAAVSAKL